MAGLTSLDLFPWGLLILAIAIYAAAVVALIVVGRRTDARAVAGFIPDCARLIRRLVSRPETSRAQRITLLVLGGYLLMPIDLVPDFIPVAGLLDDAILVTLVIGWLVRSHGEATIRAEWPGPERSLRVVLAVARLDERPAEPDPG